MVAASSMQATAAPEPGSAAKSSPFSRATSARVPPTPPACAEPTLVMIATSGSTIRARAAISPARLIPASKTAKRWCACRPNATAGTPMRLFRFPFVAWHGATAWSSEAHSSFVVVLPALPVIAKTRASSRPRRQARTWARARSPQASSVSTTSTTSADIAAAPPARPRSTTTSTAPARTAASKRSCPSCRSPRSATNAHPREAARLSLVIPCATAPSPRTNATRPPVAAAADHAVSGAELEGTGVATSLAFGRVCRVCRARRARRARRASTLGERAARLDAVVEGEREHSHELIVLVALAGDQDGVTARRGTDGEVDGGPAIELDDGLDARPANPRDHGVGDDVRVFGPGVVAGDHGDVGAAGDGLPHRPALGRVPVAAAPEDAPDASARVARVRVRRRIHGRRFAGHGPHGVEGPGQRVGRVRVVDQHGDVVAVGVAALEPPGRAGLTRQRVGRAPEIEIEGVRDPERQEQVLEVVRAHEARREVDVT